MHSHYTDFSFHTHTRTHTCTHHYTHKYQNWDCCLNILLCVLLLNHKSGFCGSLSQTCVSLKWWFGIIGWSWFSCISVERSGKLQTAGQCLSSNAVNTRKVQKDPKLDLWLLIVFVLPFLEPTHHPYYYHVQYHSPHKKSCLKQLEFWVFENYLPTQL